MANHYRTCFLIPLGTILKFIGRLGSIDRLIDLKEGDVGLLKIWTWGMGQVLALSVSVLALFR